MQPLLDLYLLVDKYADLLPKLDLNGEEQEEYSTMLLWLQNQVEGGTPRESFVNQCLAWLDRAASRLPHPCDQEQVA
jgi:hypothetical protein